MLGKPNIHLGISIGENSARALVSVWVNWPEGGGGNQMAQSKSTLLTLLMHCFIYSVVHGGVSASPLGFLDSPNSACL